MNNPNINEQSVTIRQVTGDDEFYKAIEKDSQANGVQANILWNLLYGRETQHSSPKLLAIALEGQLVGHVITFDFYQATYITNLLVREAYRRQGYGSMLLSHICSNSDRTYVLLTEVAMSDSEQLATCVHRKIFYLKNGFRFVPVKWNGADYYKYDVHIKGPDLEIGSLLAALRKGREIWNTAQICNWDK